MTVKTHTTHAVMVALTVLMLPARIVEEGLHALAALPWAAVVSVRLNPRRGAAETVVQYRDGTPEWAVTLGYVAPEIVGRVAGVAVLMWWLAGGAVWWPTTTLDWILLSLLGSQYLAIALPSAKDRDRTPSDRDVEVEGGVQP